MLIMRNSVRGCIWQAYTVETEQEAKLLTESAKSNWFIVEEQPVGYSEETSPGWKDSQEWQDRLVGRLSERAKGQEESCFLLKDIRRDGPYWLSGYKDWLVD